MAEAAISQDPASAQPAPRRAPRQKRSRERLERILNAAIALIERSGSDAMRMGEVAEKAEISIGSLYQYFPDKSALIRTLAERYNALGHACIAAELANVHDRASLREVFGGLIDTYYALFLAEPVMRDIWSGTQVDKALLDLELADSRATGALLADVLVRISPEADASSLGSLAFLIMHLGEATMRLAVSLPRPEGDAIVVLYKRMVLRELLID